MLYGWSVTNYMYTTVLPHLHQPHAQGALPQLQHGHNQEGLSSLLLHPVTAIMKTITIKF